jgi:hypothetical protein
MEKSAARLARNARATQAVLDVMAQLRDPQHGCPWDVEQNFRTIAPYTIEEAYEVADAITREDMPALKEELGDLLFQVESSPSGGRWSSGMRLPIEGCGTFRSRIRMRPRWAARPGKS